MSGSIKDTYAYGAGFRAGYQHGKKVAECDTSQAGERAVLRDRVKYLENQLGYVENQLRAAAAVKETDR